MMAKVLVIDDERTQTELLCAGLRTEGFEVVSGTCAATAMTLIENEEPDFVFVNLMLPGTNGIQLCRLIRDQFPSVRVVLTSAYPVNEPQLTRADCGALAFVPKPYNVRAIVQLLFSRLRAEAMVAAGTPTVMLHSCA